MRASIVLLLAAVAALPLARADAQPAPCPTRAPGDTTAFLPCQVDVAARADDANALPWTGRFLYTLPHDTIRGRFLVDTLGRAWHVRDELRTARGLAGLSTLHGAITSWRFTPARRGGRPVASWYEVEYVLAPPGDSALITVWPAVVHAERAPGRERLVIGWPERDSTLPPLGEDEVRGVRAAVFDALLAAAGDSIAPGRDTYCVGVDGVTNPGRRNATPDAALLDVLRASGRRVVPIGQCPKTYASMFRRVDSLGRDVDPMPPGWRDPVAVGLGMPVRWNREWVTLRAGTSQGTMGRDYQCRARVRDGRWTAACTAGRVRVS